MIALEMMGMNRPHGHSMAVPLDGMALGRWRRVSRDRQMFITVLVAVPLFDGSGVGVLLFRNTSNIE